MGGGPKKEALTEAIAFLLGHQAGEVWPASTGISGPTRERQQQQQQQQRHGCGQLSDQAFWTLCEGSKVEWTRQTGVVVV